MSATVMLSDGRFDTTGNNIIVIHYPPGGFGNFIFYILTEFANETVKSNNSNFKFGADGNSHLQKKYTNTYFHNPEVYIPAISKFVNTQDRIILVLSDNGFENESLDQQHVVFPNAKFIKVVLDDLSMAVCYKTLQVKAMLNPEFGNGQEIIDHFGKNIVDYEIRKHYSTMYHNWTLKWNIGDPSAITLLLTDLISDTYNSLTNLISSLGLTLIKSTELKDLCSQWQEVHTDFFKIYHQWQEINSALDNNQNIILDKLNLHDQGYINCCIEKKYSVTIPIYEYRNWFTSTEEIQEMLKCLK
jgi:hypothetical protein